jgi:hypothetical protein
MLLNNKVSIHVLRLEPLFKAVFLPQKIDIVWYKDIINVCVIELCKPFVDEVTAWTLSVVRLQILPLLNAFICLEVEIVLSGD